MQNDVVAVTIKGVMPTANGCAVFLGEDTKTFVIYVDHSVGNAIQMTLNGVKKERPLTHDLIGCLLLGLGAKIDHVVINDSRDGTFFARILLHMENELGKKSSSSMPGRAIQSSSPSSTSARSTLLAKSSTPSRI